jgi:K+ transporter
MTVGSLTNGAGIFKALSPHYLFQFFIRNGYQGWVYLGGTLLCITGTEAMYAGMTLTPWSHAIYCIRS